LPPSPVGQASIKKGLKKKIPDWVPRVILETALQLRSTETWRTPQASALIRAMLTHEGMRSVWAQFYKRKSKSREYCYPARREHFFDTTEGDRDFHNAEILVATGDEEVLEAAAVLITCAEITQAGCKEFQAILEQQLSELPFDSRARMLQNLAACVYFREALSKALRELDPTQGAKGKADRQFLRHTAKCLDKLAEESQRRGVEGLAQTLRLAAKDSRIAALFRSPNMGPRSVERTRTDPKIRGYVMHLANLNHGLFGNYFYGCVAATTNVAFPTAKLTTQQVREIMRSA
jgi:hypothetical protein